MKNKKLIIGLPLFLTGSIVMIFSSCNKSFLDKKPYDAIIVQDAIKTDADMSAALNGLYSSLRATDFYGRTLAVKGDLMADHCFLSSANSGRYNNLAGYSMAKTDAYAYALWLNSYKAIKNANIIINSGLAASTDAVSHMYAEAYTIRALVHFDLCRNYAVPYTKDQNALGVPIVLAFDQYAKPARNTVKEVYTQVIADLTKAYSMAKYNQGQSMSITGPPISTRIINSSFIGKYAIRALMARVYQHMGDWTNARDAALDVINNSGFTLVSNAGFVAYWKGANPITSKVETLFEVTSDANNSVADGTLAYLYTSKPFGGAYGDILPTKQFYDMHTATDIRKKLYVDTTRSGQQGRAYYVFKYPIDPSYDDVKILRFSEMYLIAAEAYYNLTVPASANNYLNLFAVTRDPSVVYNSSGTQILTDILNERLKEFAFEGYRFWDLTRLQMSFDKPQGQDASNNITSNIAVTPSTLNTIFPIPNNEILVNPNMAQNSGY
jgi:starch-binding outer membrane protein, SusD/RagB family